MKDHPKFTVTNDPGEDDVTVVVADKVDVDPRVGEIRRIGEA